MNASHLVDDVAEQVAAFPAVIDATKDSRNHVATVLAVWTGQTAQVGKQTWSTFSIWKGRFILIDEREQFIAGYALRVGSPVTPAIWRLDCRTKFLTRQLRLVLALNLQIIQKLEEHDPGKKWQAIQVA